ncbi:MAG: YsnF/AvaK domain-containing protein, partial [Roseomonas sp.]|nr:YsnF/AvaK domain-containing protein [Roseomonas sp.]
MRREGDVIVIPVVEERLVVIRRLVVTEELRIRLHEEAEAETITLPFLRQSVRVERMPGDAPGDDTTQYRRGMTAMDRTITAMFDSRPEADRGAQQLRSLGAQNVRVHAAEGSGASGARPEEDRGILAAIADLFVPDDDRATYGEGLRRGSVLVSAEVAEGLLDHAMDMLEAAGAVDLDTREEEWRGAGWVGGSAAGAAGTSLTGETRLSGGIGAQAENGTGSAPRSSTHPQPPGSGISQGAGSTTGMGSNAATTGHAGTGQEESIKLAEERLRVGKREAHAGRVRVRSYVTETPVEEQVTLREERVHVEQRPLDRPATAAEGALFQDRSIEAEESVEEAVVQKEVRVTGEVVVSKDTTEHTETIRDTVRRTEVDVDQDSVANDPRRNPGKGVA